MGVKIKIYCTSEIKYNTIIVYECMHASHKISTKSKDTTHP